MTDPAQIARSLTKAQKETILWGHCAKSTGPEDCICGADTDSLPPSLIVYRSRLDGGDGAVILSPLGYEVAAILQATPDA